MKKWLISTAAITTSLCVLSWPVNAEHYPDKETDWQVYFNAAGNHLIDNYTQGDIQESIQGMQPGDVADFEINLENKYKTPVDWYMENKVLKSFEDSTTASGGAYSYKLTYVTSKGADNVLYDSNTVGGEGVDADEQVGGVGLHEATDALDDWLFLEQIPSKGTAKMILHVELDGETQINNYQDTEAVLNVQFMVEIPETKPGEPDEIVPSVGHRKRIIYIPNTEDPFKALPYVISGLISLILFALTAYTLWRTRDEK